MRKYVWFVFDVVLIRTLRSNRSFKQKIWNASALLLRKKSPFLQSILAPELLMRQLDRLV